VGVLPVVADSLNLTLLGNFPGRGKCVYLDTTRNLMYVGALGGVAIYDASDITSPVFLASIPLDVVFSVQGYGNYLYAAAYHEGIAIIDVSAPASPILVGKYRPPWPYESFDVVKVSNGKLFAIERNQGLFVFDLSDPANPTLLDTFAGGVGYDMVVRNDTVFIASGDLYDLLILDATEPTDVRLISGFTAGFFAWALDLYVSGDTVFLADYNEGLRVVDISDPTSPVELDSLETDDGARRVAGYGGRIYVLLYNDSLLVVNPATLGVESVYHFAGDDTYELHAYGDYLFVAASDSTVYILNVSDPTSPLLVGAADFPTWIENVQVRGNYAYLADWDWGLVVVDISDISQPRIVSSLRLAWALDVAITPDGYAYVSDVNEGVAIIDVSDPEHPRYVRHYTTPGQVDDLLLDGDVLYVDESSMGVMVLDVSDRENPSLLATATASVREFFKRDTLLFVADAGGLRVFNVSDPATISEVGYYSGAPYSSDVVVAGDYAYLANYYDLQIIDVSDPTSPTLVRVDTVGNYVYHVALQDSFLYVSAADSGLKVFDVSDPANPELVAYYRPDLWSVSLNVRPVGPYVIMPMRSGGLWILQNLLVDVAERPERVEAKTLVGDGGVLIFGPYRIYDATGRLVASGNPTTPKLVPLRPGIYFLLQEGKTRKVLIR